MPSVINVGILNTNTPQQNAGIFFGEIVMTGWDANQKLVQGMGGQFGIFAVYLAPFSWNFDGFEVFDANILDQDLKPIVTSGNV